MSPERQGEGSAAPGEGAPTTGQSTRDDYKFSTKHVRRLCYGGESSPSSEEAEGSGQWDGTAPMSAQGHGFS